MDYKRVLILHYTNGMSSREIAEATGAGKTTINEFLKRFRELHTLEALLRRLRRTTAKLQSPRIRTGSTLASTKTSKLGRSTMALLSCLPKSESSVGSQMLRAM